MSFGQNLQFLRKMRNGMTQEELAEKMNVSRQTVSKWELDTVYPEIDKIIELCNFFSCSMDQLIREDLNVVNEAYSDIRCEWVEAFSYIRYAVISVEPETDAINHVREWAKSLNISNPQIIGWDFPVLSQEQINVYNMHGYAAALILEEGAKPQLSENAEVIHQKRQRYAAITIKDPFAAPFYIIPNAYKTLIAYIDANGISHNDSKDIICCFEREYEVDGVGCMDVYIAIE